MHMDNVEPASFRTFEYLEIVWATETGIFQRCEVDVGCTHAGEKDTASTSLDRCTSKQTYICGQCRQSLLESQRVLTGMCNGLLFADEAKRLSEWTKYSENQRKVLS